MAKKTGRPKVATKKTAGDAGSEAVRELATRLARLPKTAIQAPATDVRAAATFALGVAQKLAGKALRERFRSLPASEFDAQNLELLEAAAQAALSAQLQHESAEASSTLAKVPLELAQRAATQRERMLRLCDYYFEDDEQLGAEVRDIRRGAGYLDLASDLRRLAQIYKKQHAIVSQDRRLYVAQDGPQAAAIAEEILSELGRGAGKGRRISGATALREQLWRSFALLLQIYDEVAAAGRFLLRHENGAAQFPSLITAGRLPRKRPSRKPAPLPQPPAPNNP